MIQRVVLRFQAVPSELKFNMITCTRRHPEALCENVLIICFFGALLSLAALCADKSNSTLLAKRANSDGRKKNTVVWVIHWWKIELY
jgi:hypothetical protein